IAATAFPIMYSTLSPWWRYSLGRALFGCISSVALLIDYLLWRMLTHRADEWGIWLGAVLWMWLAVSMVGLINHMIRAQHTGENRNLNGSTKQGRLPYVHLWSTRGGRRVCISAASSARKSSTPTARPARGSPTRR